MSDRVENQNVCFSMTQLICSLSFQIKSMPADEAFSFDYKVSYLPWHMS